MPGLVSGNQVASFTTPVNDTPGDADEVRGNFNTLRGALNAHDADATIHVQSSALASRPSPGVLQRLWFVSDELRFYFDDGAAWQPLDYAAKGEANTWSAEQTFSGGVNAGATLALKTQSVTKWNINASGHLLATVDDSYDIGAFSDTRPRSVHAASTVRVGDQMTLDNLGLLSDSGVDISLRASGVGRVVLATNNADRWLVNENGHLGPALDGTYDVGFQAGNRPANVRVHTAVFVGAAQTNSKLTTGLSIDQGAADDEILSLKSSDVAHGVTDRTETDTFGFVKKASGLSGGLDVEGLSEDAVALQLVGIYTNGNTTKSAAASGAFVVNAAKKNLTGTAAMGANENLVVFANGGSVRFILDADGDSHQDVGTAWTNFDTHDDLALLNRLAAHVTRPDDPLRAGFGAWLEEGRSELERLRLVSFNEDGHHFVNMSRLAMLHTGAIRQLGQRFARIEAALSHLLAVGGHPPLLEA